MKILIAAALVASAAALSGCATAAKVDEALIPQLKPIEARVATTKTCGDIVREAMGTLGDAQPAAVPLTADQAMRLVQLCEQRDKDGALTLDPQGARRALHSFIVGGGAAIPGAPIP